MASPSPRRSPGRQQPQPPQDDVSDDEFSCDTQLFDEHEKQSKRFRKTLYYGELPQYSDRPSLALTSLALEFFTKSLPPRDELRFLDMEYASRVMRNACVTPASVVIALMYADRLRQNNPQYMAQANSCDLFLVSMLVASKFLYDDGAEDEVFNGDWAEAAGLELSQLNREERKFLQAIQWKLMVKANEFDLVVADMEKRIALKELSRRKDSTLTYTELDVLTKQSRPISDIYAALYDHMLKVVSVSLMSYCACLLTVFASVAAVNYVIPVLKTSKLGLPTTSSETNATMPIAGESSLPQSGLLLEHQKELAIILREGVEIENSTFCCREYSDDIDVLAGREQKPNSFGPRSWEILDQMRMNSRFGVLPNDVFPFSREPRVIFA
ncbi:protein CNPPD1 [Galendromus occidentalis]|uniref:Protein CNPPD1 n=1 Tax=Galendromus occidentalis TaxID=34638 RepID=A0AAJ6QYV6_9ACAR|nr:protein CNPPD1 [Galendromus occidentalis]